jgi:hypothetical protein
MELLQRILVASIMTIVIFLIYKFILNPQAKLQPSICPNNWKYNKPLCTPDSSSVCSAFDPSKLSKSQKIELSNRCGFQWY